MEISRKLIFATSAIIFKDMRPSLGNRLADKAEAEAIKNTLQSWFILSFDCQCDSLTIMKNWALYIAQLSDFNLMVRTCKDVYSFIINSDIEYTTIGEFKAHLTKLGVCRTFIKPIWHLCELIFIKHDFESLRLCLCWLKHITKAKIPNKDLESESLQKWLDCEEQLSHLQLSENSLIRYMQDFFSQVFKSDPHPLEGFHGNGAVSEEKTHSIDEKFNTNGELPFSNVSNMIFGQPGLLQQEYLHFTSRKCSNTRRWYSRLIFVPKASDSMRSICMEPSALMYMEEGLRVQIETLIKRCPLTKSNIFINDRLVNQNRAREASLSNMYATVDLSSASDLVSYQLIELITRTCNPLWRDLLLRCRSTHAILPNGSIVRLQKYAPMGSALCFPMETLVFTSVCYAVERITAKYFDHPEIHDYVVFGDDIVFNSSNVHQLFIALKSLGFKVNEEKSFFSGQFRESCGGDFYHGFNVTPQYNRLDLTKRKGRHFIGEFAMGLIGLANNALLSGYKHLRYYYILMLQDYYETTKQRSKLGVTNDVRDTSKLLTFGSIYTEPRRFDKKLGCMTRKCLAPKIAYSKPKYTSTSRRILAQHLRDMQYSNPDIWGINPHIFGLEDRIGRATVSYSPKWISIDPNEELW